MHLQLLPTRISHWWFQHAQHCTFTRKLHPSMRHDIWNSKLTLYIIVKKKTRRILSMICLHTLYIVSELLFILYARLYFFFRICYPIMFYVSLRLRFSLHCFHSKSFLKYGRIVMYRVIHKFLRDFRTRLRNNQDRHGRKEHINR